MSTLTPTIVKALFCSRVPNRIQILIPILDLIQPREILERTPGNQLGGQPEGLTRSCQFYSYTLPLVFACQTVLDLSYTFCNLDHNLP